MELNSKHFFLTSSQDIQELIRPLTKYFGITSFVYKKHLDDGCEIRLSNHVASTRSFYEGQFYTESLFEAKPSLYKKKMVLWDDVYDRDSRASVNSRKFDIDHGINFIEPFSDGCEFFGFGVPVGRVDLMCRYLSHIDLLEKFILYFKEVAKPLITRAEQSKIFIPNKFELARTKLITQQDLFFDREGFIKEIAGHKNYKNLSAREIQCAEFLLKGYTAKMMGEQLNLSHRTIETYINGIKKKTGSFSKSDLIRALSFNQHFFPKENNRDF